jgi:hypothetical protein
VKALKLYHGSNVVVDAPIITNRFSTLDFGTGFYTTINELQAVEFAKKVVQRRKSGAPHVSVFEIDEAISRFRVKHLFNQVVFRDADALKQLQYVNSYEVDDVK